MRPRVQSFPGPCPLLSRVALSLGSCSGPRQIQASCAGFLCFLGHLPFPKSLASLGPLPRPIDPPGPDPGLFLTPQSPEYGYQEDWGAALENSVRDGKVSIVCYSGGRPSLGVVSEDGALGGRGKQQPLCSAHWSHWKVSARHGGCPAGSGGNHDPCARPPPNRAGQR